MARVETAYSVTVYRDEPEEAAAGRFDCGWFGTRETAESVAKAEIVSRFRNQPPGNTAYFSATLDEGHIEKRRVDGRLLLNFVDDPDGHQWAIGFGADGWWQDQYR